MKIVLACVISVALLSGCASAPPGAKPERAEPVATRGLKVMTDPPVGAWFNPGGEFPPMCMQFAPDGQLQFGNGFTFFNPSSWRFDQARKELEITLGGPGAFPVEWARDHQARHPETGLRFDAERRTVVYRVDRSTQSIDFGSFYFYRQASCSGS